jgi:hypothetical protein
MDPHRTDDAGPTQIGPARWNTSEHFGTVSGMSQISKYCDIECLIPAASTAYPPPTPWCAPFLRAKVFHPPILPFPPPLPPNIRFPIPRAVE